LTLNTSHDFDLIITDLFVPSTTAAVKRVRRLQQLAGATPVLVMTGTWLGRDLSAAQLGVSDLLFKPFDTNLFLARIAALAGDTAA
jgi:CheY-like chemotaxis protein